MPATPAKQKSSRRRNRSRTRRSDSIPSSSGDSDIVENETISGLGNEKLLAPIVEEPSQPLSLINEPASAYGVPWGNQWPEILDFYMNNPSAFEYTGANYYKNKGEIAALHETYSLPRISPATLTLRILFAESARPGLRSTQAQRIWLKQQAIALVNAALADPAVQLSAETLLDVLTLHNYERVFDNNKEAVLAHRAGIARMIGLMGGIKNIKGTAEKHVPMILWGDRARQAARAHDPTEAPPEYPLDFHSGLQPLHPLNLALLPWDRLSTAHERTLALGTSILGPGVKLMIALDTLRKLSRYAAFASPVDHTAIRLMRHELSVVEDGLLTVVPHDAEIYANPKYAMQQLMIEAAKLSGLIVIHILSNIYEQTSLTRDRVDHMLTRAAMLNLEPLLDKYPKMLLWAVFLQAPFQIPVVQKRYLDLACAVIEALELGSWEETKALLESVYYYPEIQDKPAHAFWTYVEEFRAGQPRQIWHEDSEDEPEVKSE